MAKHEVDECYTIGVDLRKVNDLSVLVVVKRVGNIPKVINTYYGKEAEKKYKQFIKNFCTPIVESM